MNENGLTDQEQKELELKIQKEQYQADISNHRMQCPICGTLMSNQKPNRLGILEDTEYECDICGWTDTEDFASDILMKKLDNLTVEEAQVLADKVIKHSEDTKESEGK